jgi:hypothetical protein
VFVSIVACDCWARRVCSDILKNPRIASTEESIVPNNLYLLLQSVHFCCVVFLCICFVGGVLGCTCSDERPSAVLSYKYVQGHTCIPNTSRHISAFVCCCSVWCNPCVLIAIYAHMLMHAACCKSYRPSEDSEELSSTLTLFQAPFRSALVVAIWNVMNDDGMVIASWHGMIRVFRFETHVCA